MYKQIACWIFNKSLAEITDEYLEYIDNNENLSIDEIADFLVVAAKLLYIKSKLILPRSYELYR